MDASGARGFSLLEALFAVTLLAVGVGSVAHLSILSGQAVRAARQADTLQRLAREKLEQLRALAFGRDEGGVDITDSSSDLTQTPQAPAGGPGLTTSVGDPLLSNVAGFCDFLDVHGRWLASGTSAPVGAAWVRRWSVQALTGLPDTLLLQVVVLPAHIVGAADTVAVARNASSAWLVDIRARRDR